MRLTFDETTHTYWLDGEVIPSVTQVMKPLSEACYGDIDAGTLNIAANRGHIVHSAIETLLKDDIEGTDYSVCVLADNGKVTHICGYYGYEMDYGSVVNGEISKNDKAYEIAEKIIADLAFDGNACFDFIIKPDGTPELLEINPRLNASLPFVAKAGLNLAYLRCKQLLGTDVTKYNPTIQYGLRMSKYYESEYFV